MSQSKTPPPNFEWPTDRFFNPFEALMPLQKAQLEAVTKATQTFMDGMMAINREMLSFADERVRRLREEPPAPTGGQPLEMWTQQLDRASSATQAYLQEANRLFELGMKVSQESWAPLQEQMVNALQNGQSKTKSR